MIVIIGGGASGVILAAHLLRVSSTSKIVLIEKREAIGRGLAYSTTLPDHLLNVRVQNMSALPDDPGHFMRWLKEKDLIGPDDAFFFAPRKVYGNYLQDLIHDAIADHPGRLQIIRDEAVAAIPESSGVHVKLASGQSFRADKLVLATGHDMERLNPDALSTRIDSPEDTALDPDAPVLILGSGLSMVDAVLSLEARNHRGPVTVISRRGLLPQRQVLAHPVGFDETEIPLGREPSRFLAWLRARVRAHEQSGGNWRDVIDGLRPFNQRIWQSWPDKLRLPFLRHGKAWWDTHRHRMAPEIHDRISTAIREGRLVIRAAKIVDTARMDEGIRVTIKPRGTSRQETVQVSRIYNCTGIIRDVENSSRAILQSLVEAGLAKADPLRLSFHVSRGCQLVARDGKPSDRLYALGPLTRSEFFEIDAIPEIRVQCAELAKQIGTPEG